MSTKKDTSTFEDLYLKEKKKSSILLGGVVVLAVLATLSLSWAITKKGAAPQGGAGSFAANLNGQNPQGGPGGGGMRQMDFTEFFNDDGSVKTERVQEMLGRMPSGNSDQNFLTRIKEDINQAVEDGKITQEQATALINAFQAEQES